MKLLLLSNTQGNNNPQVLELIDRWFVPSAKIAYVPSSTDPSRKYFFEVSDWFKSIKEGLNTDYLEIHDGTIWNIDQLTNYDGVYISGGNTYNLLTGLRNSKMEEAIKLYVRKLGKPVIGVSAGGIVLTPEISISRSENTIGLTNESGLSIVNFRFYPHYNDSPDNLDEINRYLGESSIKELFALTEFSGLHIEDNKLTTLGEAFRFTPSSNRPEILGSSEPIEI